jgi:hypothetical protein
VNAALTDDLLASYVVKDTDSDGLPDWQETLYGTDVNKADTDGDGISDGEAVKRGLLTPNALASQIPADPIGKDEPLPGTAPTPGSMTDQFAKSFFQSYMEASGGQPMTADAQQTLITQLLTDFNARGARALASSYTTLSIRTNASASEDDYATAVVRAIQENSAPEGSDNPPVLMQALMEQKDESARTKLIAIGKADAAVAHELLTVPVPPALADEHLRMIRSLDTLSKATQLVANYDRDPVGAMSALALYAPTSQEFLKSIEDIATEMVRGGEPADGTSEALIVSLARALQAQGI